MAIVIKWTDEKKEKTILAIEAWIKEHGAAMGEIIMQSDSCIISAPELLSDLVDDIIKPEYVNE